jgi:FixJ family two-component response regulator
VLILSGDLDHGGESEQFGGLTSFLEKPVLAGELLDAVQRLLDVAGGSQRVPGISS